MTAIPKHLERFVAQLDDEEQAIAEAATKVADLSAELATWHRRAAILRAAIVALDVAEWQRQSDAEESASDDEVAP